MATRQPLSAAAVAEIPAGFGIAVKLLVEVWKDYEEVKTKGFAFTVNVLAQAEGHDLPRTVLCGSKGGFPTYEAAAEAAENCGFEGVKIARIPLSKDKERRVLVGGESAIEVGTYERVVSPLMEVEGVLRFHFA